jgi:excisionase family DNA binding protein
MTRENNSLQSSATRLLYDRKEAARQLSISVRSLDYLISNKELQTRRLGKKVMVPHAELVRFASSNHYDPMSPN